MTIEIRQRIRFKKYRDLTGERYGRLTVIGRADNPTTPIHWRTVCVCGQERIVRGGALRNGNTASCGCLRLDHVRAARLLHGHSTGHTQSPEYQHFARLKGRCSRPEHVLCDEWAGRGGFEAFLAAVGSMPAPGMRISRIDSSKPYGPGNAVWADRVRLCTRESGSKKIF